MGLRCVDSSFDILLQQALLADVSDVIDTNPKSIFDPASALYTSRATPNLSYSDNDFFFTPHAYVYIGIYTYE